MVAAVAVAAGEVGSYGDGIKWVVTLAFRASGNEESAVMCSARVHARLLLCGVPSRKIASAATWENSAELRGGGPRAGFPGQAFSA